MVLTTRSKSCDDEADGSNSFEVAPASPSVMLEQEGERQRQVLWVANADGVGG